MSTDLKFVDDNEVGYAKRFNEALYNLSEHDFKKQWIYIGGDTGYHKSKFVTEFKDENAPSHKTTCICSKEITENCYIKNKITGVIVVTGNCCIKKYLGVDTSKSCSLCGSPHNNRLDNYCSICRGEIIFWKTQWKNL
ncbi:MAG: hypothetical protein PHG66_00505 [Candidatus Colwellbacteria bacterium]|nr:hypothetical protein [Candidatus Colwellbacteria bacterium]